MNTSRVFLFALLLASFAGTAGADEVRPYDPAWAKCSADKDCVAVPGVCDGWVAVHEAHSGDMQAYQQSAAPYVECASDARGKTDPPKARCLQDACTF